MNDRIKQILMIMAAIAVVIILTYLIDFESVIETLRAADKNLLLLSAIAMIAGFILVSIRLRYILGMRAGLNRIFYGDALGFMTTPFIPLPTPVLRAIGVERTTLLNASTVSPAVAVDYLLGFVMRVIALLFVIFLAPSAIDSAWAVVRSILLVIALFGGLIWLVNHLDQVFDAIARWLNSIPRIDKERVRSALNGVQEALEAAGSTRSLLISLFYTLVIMFFFALYHYLAWAALPLDLNWRQMLALSMAVLVVVPPSAPMMIGAYQGILVGTLALLRVLDVATLTAYAILVQAMQIVFWLIVGIWVLTRTKIHLRDLIQRPDNLVTD